MKLKSLILPLLVCFSIAHAHEIKGTFKHGGPPAKIPRMKIPFDTSARVEHGRVYTLWIAPDGALVFYLQDPPEGTTLEFDTPDSHFRIWLVEARQELRLPDGFETMDPDKRNEVQGAQEMTGKIHVSWRSASDYTIRMNAVGTKDGASFDGCLFGSSANPSQPDK